MEFFKPAQAMPQIATRTAELEPVIGLICEFWNKLIINHFCGLAKIGKILACMAAGLGHKVPKLLHEFDADRLLAQVFRLLDSLPDCRVKVFIAATEFQEKGLMIDAGAEKSDLGVRNANPVREHFACVLDAV